MPAQSADIEGRIRGLAQAAASRTGCELVNLEYRREADGWKVRLFIDKPGGVNLEDCRRVSLDFGTVMEVEDPIPHQYTLEVSSPGLDRRLVSHADFEAAVGKRVRLVTREPIQGRRNFTVVLEAVTYSNEAGGLRLTLRDESGVEHVMPAGGVERARLIFDWPQVADRTAEANPSRPTARRSKSTEK